MPKKAVEKKEESYKMLKSSQLVLGFLHSVKHTGSPQDESDIHSYFIPRQNNKSSKCKLKRKKEKEKKEKEKKAAPTKFHSSGFST